MSAQVVSTALLEAVKADAIAQAATRPTRRKFDPEHASASRVMRDAPEKFNWIVEHLFPIDVGLIFGAGGEGKTTLVLDMAIDFILGNKVFGNGVDSSGSVLFISGEDPDGDIGLTLKRLCRAHDLNDDQLRVVQSNLYIEDFSAEFAQLIESDGANNLIETNMVAEVIEAYKDKGVKWVVIDPLASFGPGERHVNDGMQKVIIACRKVSRAFDCFVSVIHHESKDSTKESSVGMQAYRGGSALADGSRFAAQVKTYYERKPEMPPTIPDEVFDGGGCVMAFHVHKLSRAAKPRGALWVSRVGYKFTWHPNTDAEADKELVLQQALDRSNKIIKAVAEFVRSSEDHQWSKNLLIEAWMAPRNSGRENHKLGGYAMNRKLYGEYIDMAIDKGELIDVPLPVAQGAKKSYLTARKLKF